MYYRLIHAHFRASTRSASVDTLRCILQQERSEKSRGKECFERRYNIKPVSNESEIFGRSLYIYTAQDHYNTETEIVIARFDHGDGENFFLPLTLWEGKKISFSIYIYEPELNGRAFLFFEPISPPASK